MDECEVTSEAPAWMLALEKKRQRIHKLAHEVGAGSPCLLCGQSCPGLDLHFWRKICRNCKCKKEDHDVVDDFGCEQFEILLGAGHLKHLPKTAFLELHEKQTSSTDAGQAKRVAFDWVPPNVPPDVAAEYMQALPTNKLPISGSDGALYRRQQLERQLPLHDLDARHCHQLTDYEIENLQKYLENIQNNVVGQGRISKYTIPVSKSAEVLPNVRTFNSAPKPFRTVSAQSCMSQSTIVGQTPVGSSANMTPSLKPPSAFLPRHPSPDSQSSSRDSDLPSLSDRSALFGVTLSPSSRPKQAKKKSIPNLTANPVDSLVTSVETVAGLMPAHEHSHNLSLHRSIPVKSFHNTSDPNEIRSHLVKDSVPNLVAHSGTVPGNMWIPHECPECTQIVVSGRLVSDRVCSHVSTSDQLSHNVQIGLSSSIPPSSAKISRLHGANSLHFTKPEELRECYICPVGLPCHHDLSLIRSDNQLASVDAQGATCIPQKSSQFTKNEPVLTTTTLDCQEEENTHKLGDSLQRGILKASGTGSYQSPLLISVCEPENTASYMGKMQRLSPDNNSLLHRTSPSSGAAGSPHVMALYAHNALHSPSGLDPQDRLSPHLASLALDDAQFDNVNRPEGTSIDRAVPNSDHLLLELKCAQCLEHILPGEVVVYADRAGQGIVWHPKCFVCNTCQELLVDLVYFYSKGHVYCGRHFAELLDIPRCSACDELIFVKEYTVAEGQSFHVKHFCCFECDVALGGKQYVPKDGQPVCLPCFEEKYGKTCETCHRKIGARDQGVTWKDLHWHAKADCFCCASCLKSLLGGRFAVKEQRPFCSKECMQKF